jgi:D-alanine-D-alanine ligase
MGFTREQLLKMKIGLVYGGQSEEREVSLRSGTGCGEALKRRGYDVVFVDADREVAATLRREKVEVAFIALHGRWGEDGCIQGVLEVMGIPYTGSGLMASALGMDKRFSKRIFLQEGIPIPPHAVVPSGGTLWLHDLPFGLPAVVKPSGSGSSVGITIVKSEAELQPAIELARKYPGDVLIERYIKGREISDAVLDDEPLGAVEIVPANEFYDYAAKYTAGTTKYLFPAPVTQEQYQRACDLAVQAHRALNCSGATRTDFILEEGGRLWTLEVNTLPGMTATSLVPKIAAGRGIDFESLCERLLQGASLKA